MRPSDVCTLLGDEQQYEEWMGGNLNDFMFYKGILIGFGGENEESPAESSGVVLFELHCDQPLSLYGETLGAASKADLLHLLRRRGLPFQETSRNVVRVKEVGLQFTLSKTQRLERIYLQNHPG